MAHPGGRPTKYNDLTMEIAENYLKNYASYGHVIPSHVGLSLVLGINSDTIYAWGKDPRKPEFSEMLTRILDLQHFVLVSKGLSGEYNSNIVKLVLTKHGYKDRSETDQNIIIHEKTIDDLE